MKTLRPFALAAIVAAGAGLGMTQTSAADSGVGVRVGGDNFQVDVRHRDRDYYSDRWDDRRHYRHRARARCWTDVDYRYRFGHRVRVVERICVDRRGRHYVASRNYIRVGFRY
jgi:hypothetical protein